MFDPEKVERWCESGMLEPRDFVVSASDYDQLLELYRSATKPPIDGKDFCIVGGEVVMNRRADVISYAPSTTGNNSGPWYPDMDTSGRK